MEIVFVIVILVMVARCYPTGGLAKATGSKCATGYCDRELRINSRLLRTAKALR